MNTADLMIEILEYYGVEYIFGVPGGAIEDLNMSIYHNKTIKPIVTKHEAGAAFMADGYARVSGRLGVCTATAGPGASNLITGLASSYADFISVLALTGQVATTVFGKGAIQESGSEGVNITNIFRNFTKYSGMLITEERAQYMLQKAIRLALTGPAGPTHLNLPTDLMKKAVTLQKKSIIKDQCRLCDGEAVREAAKLLLAAKRPAIIAGWGVVLSRAANELLELAKLLQAPVASSPKAKGVFPENHALSLGVLGFAGNPVAKEYITTKNVDVLLGVGTSFSEMMTSGWDENIRPSDHLIHIDIDEEKIGKNYFASLAMVGDARMNLQELTKAIVEERAIQAGTLHTSTVAEDLVKIKTRHAEDIKQEKLETSGNLYHPKRLVMEIQDYCPDDTIFFADIGNSMAWAIRHMTIVNPYSFFVSLGYGSMGYAVAAPVGAKLAVPEQTVVAMVGDGSFLMNGFEVATAVDNDIPVIWVVFNNAMLGMVYHGRRLFKNPIPEGLPSRFKRVDYAMVAEGLGARGIRIDTDNPLSRELMNDIIAEGRPTVLDVWIDDQIVPPIHSRIATVDKHFG
ncbi:MAG: thiamine pyrophosphate-binding protein [Proteobacteria bacterium]|nr:thiamine pyrophosphate-binding protein [Pseudomonadota bacterium]